MNLTSVLSFEGTPQERNAYTTSLIFLVISALSFPVYAFIAYQAQVWQGWFLVVLTTWLMIASAAGMRLSKHHKPGQAMVVMIVAVTLGGWLGALLLSGLGILMAVLIAMISVIFAAQALPRQWLNRVLMMGIAAGVLAALLGISASGLQAKIPLVQNAVPVLAGLAFIGFGVIITRQFPNYPFSTKILTFFLVIALLSVGVVAVTVNLFAARMELNAQDVTTIQNVSVFASLAAIFLAGLLSAFTAQLLTRPVGALTQTARQISNGDLNARANVNTDDEIGELASSFNIMTTQLRETLAGLEQRVQARTKDLATVAEVGTASATILESKRLLQEIVDLTKERFNLYHSHIYLLDEGGQNLALASGAGETGRQMVLKGHSIPLDREQSLVARAARERKGVTVNDVSLAADFLPNPHLPDTRSELAVPMIVGGKMIGVFDVQSDQVGRFTDSDINIQTTLAAQVATSIQNVRSFEQSKAQADLESLVNAIGQKIQRATTVDDTLQTAIREIGLALGAERVSANIQTHRQRGGDEVSAIEPGV
jgi:putative methionine-R-sulfoxide reductase with GAF domain